MTTDWSQGSYERTATELEPVSRLVVERAGIAPGDRVLDIACGTGNAALKAAELGATVTGVDLAERLVRVAAARAQSAGLDARFLVGDAEALPVPDASADVVLSVFGVMFAPDAERAAAEIVRVLVPGGRALVTAWVRSGALAEVGAATARAQAALAPEDPEGPPPPGRTPTDWSDAPTVAGLFAAHPVTVTLTEERLTFRAPSPDAWVREQAEHHPVWLGARRRLGEERFAALARQMVEILLAHNEDPAGLQVTSRYAIATITRD
jgi:SAM-dependent methyltransferase